MVADRGKKSKAAERGGGGGEEDADHIDGELVFSTEKLQEIQDDLEKKWPGLPRGVKFNPSDEELLWHLLAQTRKGEAEPHPFIGEFIISRDEDDGFGHFFPLKLPGVKQDGSLSYFFHRTFKIHNNNHQKRRKIVDDESGTVCWHKVGETKPVYADGIHKGSKKTMVLYMRMADGGKPEKTNWIMHRYHIGMGEDVEGDLVISKIFYRLKFRQGDKIVHDACIDTVENVGLEGEPEADTKFIVSESHARNSNLISMNVRSQDMFMDNYGTKDVKCSDKNDCNTANEGEAPCDMSNSSHSMLDDQAHTRHLCPTPAPNVICETSGQVRADFHTSNMLDPVKVEISNYIQEITGNEVDNNISPSAMEVSELSCESENDEIDHVTLQKRYKVLLSNMNLAFGCCYTLESSQYIGQCPPGFSTNERIHEAKLDSGFISAEESHGAPKGHSKRSKENFSEPQDSSFRPTINNIGESCTLRIKDEIRPSDKLFDHDECELDSRKHGNAISVANPSMESLDHATSGSRLAFDQDLQSFSCLNKVLSDAGSHENRESGKALLSQASAPEARLSMISQVSGDATGKSKPDSPVTFAVQMKLEPVEENMANNTSSNDPLSGRCKSQQYQEGDGRHSAKDGILRGRPLDSVQGLLHFNDNNHPGETVQSVLPVEVKAERLEDSGIECRHRMYVEELSCPHETALNSNKKLCTSILSSCSIRPKLESMEIGPLGPCEEIDILKPIAKMECIDDLTTDYIDYIPLRERMQMLTSISFTNLSCDSSGDNALQTIPPSEYGPSDVKNAKTRRVSLKRKRKKTATDSVETALEEDAPGLLQVLLDKGITVEEIKLYGDTEDEEALPISSSEDSFDQLETIISKLFSEGPSMLKFPSIRQMKGSKAVYCLACLISLIEQARYLRFRQSPVEWGWCRDLQSFIFVFERHNRIVLERPEYGYATYFFELVHFLPIDWQIKRLVTAMKLPCCSRTVLLENKPLLVGEDLTEGEACVMEEYGWIRNSGLGTMLNYCDRVVHDKKNEKYSLEWGAKIGNLLMKGFDSGRTVVSNLPKKAAQYVEHQYPQVKLEN